MDCQYCQGHCKKDGKQHNGEQKYRCKSCKKYQQKIYKYKACRKEVKDLISRLMVVGNSYCGLSRGLGINRGTISTEVLERGDEVERNRQQPQEEGQEYEIDEVQTFIGRNKPGNYVYIGYAMNCSSKSVPVFVVGRRTTENIRKVTESVLKLKPNKVYTDRLNLYKNLLPKEIHCVSKLKTVHIERSHLTIRTNIRAMQRRTLCYSKSITTLTALLRLYFWRN